MRQEKRAVLDQRPRLTQLSGGIRIRELHSLVDKKFRVDKILIGGGGNPDIECLAMCQALIEGWEQAGEVDLSWAVEELRK